MSTNGRNTASWHEDRRCPAWCTTGERHLTDRLRGGADFWHRCATLLITTNETDHNWHPIRLAVGLLQREQVDERGHIRHPVEVLIEPGWSFTPEQARELAAALCRLADQAENEPHDLSSRPNEELAE